MLVVPAPAETVTVAAPDAKVTPPVTAMVPVLARVSVFVEPV